MSWLIFRILCLFGFHSAHVPNPEKLIFWAGECQSCHKFVGIGIKLAEHEDKDGVAKFGGKE